MLQFFSLLFQVPAYFKENLEWVDLVLSIWYSEREVKKEELCTGAKAGKLNRNK